MDKVWVVCRREFGTQIRRISFWVTTLGVPLFIIGVGIFIGAIGFYIGSRAVKKSSKKVTGPIAVIDQVGAVNIEALMTPENPSSGEDEVDPELQKFLEMVNLPASLEEKFVHVVQKKAATKTDEFKALDSLELAEKALSEESVRGYVLFPQGFPDTEPAKVVWYDRKHRKSLRGLASHVRDQLLIRSMDAETIPKVLSPLRDAEVAYRFEIKEKEKKKPKYSFDFSAIGLPLLFAVAMMMVTMFSADRLLRGLVEEKQNRVIEILLSSVSADQLLAGKVIGLGMIGLVQLAIWTLIAFLPASFVLTFFSLDVSEMLVCFVLFLLGYFQLSTLILGLGSMGNTFQEASQWSMVCSMLAMSPLMLWPLVFQDLESGLVTFFTYFPLTSPLMAMLRYGLGAISLWEVSICVAVLIASNFLAIRFGAKLFRLGILLTGKTPSPRTVWKMLRAS